MGTQRYECNCESESFRALLASGRFVCVCGSQPISFVVLLASDHDIRHPLLSSRDISVRVNMELSIPFDVLSAQTG